jgi:hypothetical protein
LASDRGPSEWAVSSFVAYERSTVLGEGSYSDRRIIAGVDVGKVSLLSKELLRARGDFDLGGGIGHDYSLRYSSSVLFLPRILWGFDVGTFKGQRFESQGQIGLDLRWQSNAGLFFRRGDWNNFLLIKPGGAFETSNYFESTANDIYGSLGFSGGLSGKDQDFILETTGYLLVTDGDDQLQDNSRVETFLSYTYWVSKDARLSLGTEYHRYFRPAEIQRKEFWRLLAGFSYTIWPHGEKASTEVPREVRSTNE